MGRFAKYFEALGRRRAVLIVASVVLLFVGGWSLKAHRYHFVPIRVVVVEPGGIVRGARQSPRVMERLIAKHNFRTIINLDDKILEGRDKGRDDLDRYREEKQLARRLHIRYVSYLWNGSGEGPYEEYDEVAQILADPSNRPVFVHCSAGAKRANVAVAAYWIRGRGYSLEQTLEALRKSGLSENHVNGLARYLKGYSEYVHRNSSHREPAAY